MNAKSSAEAGVPNPIAQSSAPDSACLSDKVLNMRGAMEALSSEIDQLLASATTMLRLWD